jgi:hypothetical protein
MKMNQLDFTEARINGIWGKNKNNDGGFEICWAVKNFGFGLLAFYLKNGKLYVDEEGLGKTFAMGCLAALVSDAILDNIDNHKDASAKDIKKILSIAKKGKIKIREIKKRDAKK